MKILAACLLVAVAACGCSSAQKEAKHWISGAVGLKRTITVYRLDGTPLREWRGQFMVEIDSGVVSFIDSAQKEVKIAGGIVIVEEQP